MRRTSPLTCISLLALVLAVAVLINPFGRNLGATNATVIRTAQGY